MRYEIEIQKPALRDLKGLPKPEAQRIMEKVRLLSDSLFGDVKRLTNFTPEYRLRVGKWRVLFEVEEAKVIVYRVKHRREAYR